MPVLYLLILSSAYAEANGEGQNMIRVRLVCLDVFLHDNLGPVVQNFVSLTSSLRPQLVK